MKTQEEIVGEFRINHSLKTIFCPYDSKEIPARVTELLMLKRYVLQYEIR